MRSRSQYTIRTPCPAAAGSPVRVTARAGFLEALPKVSAAKAASGLRSGFTLIELTVVVAIVGLLVCLILPAVQAARETSRRIQCLNNLHQIGTAIHGYHEVYGSLPAGHLREYDPRSPSVGAFPPCTSESGEKSFLTLILPEMEQAHSLTR